MKILGMLCPHCGDSLKRETHRWPEHWIGSVYFSMCEPCERFFYILADEDQSPVAVIDAEHGIGQGDDGYSFDWSANGEDRDDEGWYYYQQWLAKQPKCGICGVRKPVEDCDRCQKCLDRFGVEQVVQS